MSGYEDGSGQNMTITNLQQLENYLSYYRQKLDKFEEERIEWQQQAEQTRQQLERGYYHEFEILQKKNEISELQKAMSDARLSLYDERQQFMKLKRDYVMLQNQIREDDRRIQELKSLNEDIENNSGLLNFKDVRPLNNQSIFSNTTIADSQQVSMNKSKTKDSVRQKDKPKHNNSLAINKSQYQKEASKKQLQDKYNHHVSKVNTMKQTISTGGTTMMRSVQQSEGNYGTGIIKTVILPNEEINRLGIEAEELRLFLDQQKQVFEESIQAYEKDRVIREQEFKLKETDFKEKLQALQDRLKFRQEINYQLSKEYFDYKHSVNKAKQRLQDDFDLAKVENQALKSQLDKILDVSKNDTSHTQQVYSTKTNNFASRFRKQSKENEEDLNIVKVQYGQVQEKYLTELKTLETQLAQVIDKCKLLQNRRGTEQNAFTNDVGTLKKRVKEYELYIKGLKDLVDEEKTQTLVHRLNEEIDFEGVLEEISKVEEEVKEAKRFNINNQQA